MNIKELFKKIIEFLKEQWNLYSPIVISTLASLFSQWNANQVLEINQYISLTISMMCLLTMIKFLINPKGKKNVIESIISTTANVKKADLIIHQDEQLENTLEMLKQSRKVGIIFMEKIKNFFSRIWGNKFTILNITFNLLAVAVVDFLVFSEYLLRFNFFVENELAFKIGIPVLSVLYLVLDIFTTVTKYGWESLDELNEKSEQKALEKAGQLTKEQKTFIKSQLKQIKDAMETAQKNLVGFEKVISNFELAKSLSIIPLEAEQVSNYNQAVNQKMLLSNQISKYKQQIAILEERLK